MYTARVRSPSRSLCRSVLRDRLCLTLLLLSHLSHFWRLAIRPSHLWPSCLFPSNVESIARFLSPYMACPLQCVRFTICLKVLFRSNPEVIFSLPLSTNFTPAIPVIHLFSQTSNLFNCSSLSANVSIGRMLESRRHWALSVLKSVCSPSLLLVSTHYLSLLVFSSVSPFQWVAPPKNMKCSTCFNSWPSIRTSRFLSSPMYM